jgi:hypothetical protein
MGGVSGAGFGSVASPQQPERSSPTQPQNPYGAPTITNPYSPEDRRQFGFQIPYQLQMNQQRQMPQLGPDDREITTMPIREPQQGGSGNSQRLVLTQQQIDQAQPQQQQFNPYRQQQFNPYMQQQRPNPYQMYGGLGSLFSMQDAYSQRPAPITQAQSNEANRRLLEKYKTTAQQPAQQPVQQQPVQQAAPYEYYNSADGY